MATAGRSARILVIEPELGLRQLVVRALEQARVLGERRYVLLATGDTLLSRQLLDAGTRIDLVVTSLRLDVWDNVEFLDGIERAFPGIPILHLVGALFGGRAPFTAEHFSVDRILMAVERCLSTGRGEPASEDRRVVDSA